VRFHHGRVPDLFTDEPPPLGAGDGPSAKELLAAAIGHCLASSLLFCMQKARLEPRDLEIEVVVETGRNGEGRLRIQRVDVKLSPSVTPEVRDQMGRCLEVFESFCTVTQSVRQGFPVGVTLDPHVVSTPPLEGAR
jgi:organic hydroperoxide reductase OsmC/OhrA